MVIKFINYSKKIIVPIFAVSYGVYLNYSFFSVVKNDLDKQKR